MIVTEVDKKGKVLLGRDKGFMLVVLHYLCYDMPN